MPRRTVALLLPAALALVAGCTGSTEPATEIGPHSAKLNAHGHADNGPNSSYFEFWPTDAGRSPFTRTQTPSREWPAGARGPLSETVAPLLAGTRYTFRVCGGGSGQSTTCANERTFTTASPATKDVVLARFAAGGEHPYATADLSATSTASGGAPGGTYTQDGAVTYRGRVTCVAVQGSRAVVGVVGTVSSLPQPEERPETRLVVLADGGPGGRDTVAMVWTGGSTPPNCADASSAVPLGPEFTVVGAVQDAR